MSDAPLHPGQRVVIKQGHPWGSFSGDLVSLDELRALGTKAWRVRLDSGIECYATVRQLKVASP